MVLDKVRDDNVERLSVSDRFLIEEEQADMTR